MDRETIAAIIEWDVINWENALNLWQNELNRMSSGGKLDCLELGGRSGGLSLWLAMNGHSVICSDLENPKNVATKLHDQYTFSGEINYEAVNALEIPFSNQFDAVAFKSILGGISRDGRDELNKKTIDEIYKSLKPGGVLFFAENLESSWLHRVARKYFVKWGSNWNYLKYKDVPAIFSTFDHLTYQTVGFFAAFGRTEKQRQLLGKFDRFVKVIIPKSKRYVVYGVARKN